ncbi:MltA specific insert domain-containing protein [Colwellia chukchiensis]|uniref:MltA specific insert domain-containing protein n=1 Tax=Colwellia chukchiensis TaxID=641665 RepID=A0A1H7PVT3_9GAMM|nr:MltA domain-containing protein [Colwellia chukchiensis]SEL39514.1 MltA specific insert domain-containing protein [Colwellia chukchiensis]
MRFYLSWLVFFLVSFYSVAKDTPPFFRHDNSPELGLMANFKASALCEVAEGTHNYIQQFSDDKFAVHAGTVFDDEVTLTRVEKTLAFICQTYRADVRAKRNSRLHEPEFLRKHFDFYRWTPDRATAQAIAKKSTNAVKSRMLNAIPQDKIFLTKYYTKLLKASAVKTAEYNQALYALPYDEAGISLAEANKDLSLTRHQYTRQQVIAGVLEQNKLAKPLIWLTEEALHDVLLQGTGVVEVNGVRRYFNVHRNNGVAYDYAIGKREQARYWYFAEVPSIMGYGETLLSKIALAPQVAFAGNVAQLGLGKLFMVSYQQQGQRVSRLGVLADQGGAFDNNLFQLDLLVDSYYGWQDYHQANKHLADYAQAWLMLVKPAH